MPIAAPLSRVGMKTIARAVSRPRSFWLRSRAASNPNSIDPPTAPIVNQSEFHMTLWKFSLFQRYS
jgi:hypothetical protein